MTPTTPAPVHSFFIRFLMKQNEAGLRAFCLDLLNLEFARVRYNVFLVPPLFKASEGYKADIARARRALKRARLLLWTRREDFDLPHHWLTLLGHRLAVERGLATKGIAALAHVASGRLDLPLKETEAWSEEMLFRQYTDTFLRDEWDYPGLMFRYVRSEWPPEEV